MDAGTLSVKKIFGQDRRHVVPLFQRPYVWQRAEQWEPLWDDLRNTAERVQHDGDVRAHFLGAIVLDQYPQRAGCIETRLVVDGQQRLTTLQIFLEAFCDLCLAMGADKHHKALLKLTRNDDPMSNDEDDDFKVWPTNVDQEHFRRVMRCETPDELREKYGAKKGAQAVGHAIADGYLYFHAALEEWFDEEPEDQEERLDALLSTMRDYVRLVVIDLAKEDNAQLIFETLNARGTPLLPSDLIKNFLFHIAEEKSLDIEKLYKKYWRRFDEDHDYWREPIGKGHAQRARIDLFLMYYLAVQIESDVQVAHLYTAFRDFVNEHGNPEAVLASIGHFAEVYRSFERFPRGSREWYFFNRINTLQVTSTYPLLLEVFDTYGTDAKVLHQILDALESFLIRRMVCHLNTRGYNRLFYDFLKTFKRERATPVESVHGFLLQSESESARWPSDDEFLQSWAENPLYRVLTRQRVRMLLEALELAYRTEKTEKLQLEEKLTIEHLMPQQWQPHWPLDDGEDPLEATQLRGRYLHTIGNLTLLNKKLNPSVSNGTWAKKQKELANHSLLRLNQKLAGEEEWNEKHIQARSKALFKVAKKIWKRPE